MLNTKIIFDVEERPPILLSIMAGLQHTLTMIGNTIMVPSVLAIAFGMPKIELTEWLGYVMLTMGIATLFQINKSFGSQLPIIQGPSAAYIICITTLIPYIHPYAKTTSEIMQYLGGALILGGLVEMLLGYFNLIGKLKRIITPVVICPVLMSIGFSLANIAIDNASQCWPISLLTLALVLYFSFGKRNKSIINIFSAFSILASFTIMYLVCLICSDIGIFTPEHPAYIKLDTVIMANWIRPIENIMLPYGLPKFDLMAFIIILPGVFVSIIESIGDYHSISHICHNKMPTENTINKGIGSEGIGVILSGIFGGLASTSYSENIAAVKITGIASRFVIGVSAVILILLSFFGKFAAIIASIPPCVLGGAYIILFAIIGAAGLSILDDVDTKNNRNLVIIGIAFLASMGLPQYINARRYIFNSPEYNEYISLIGEFLWDILKSPMAVSAIVAITLDRLVPINNNLYRNNLLDDGNDIIIINRSVLNALANIDNNEPNSSPKNTVKLNDNYLFGS